MKDINLEDYLPYVKSIIAPYRNAGVPYEDLVQEGMLGLWEAVKRYDPQKNAKLTTYAAYWIKKRILAAIKKEKKDSMDSSELNEDITASDEKDTASGKIVLPENMPEDEKNILVFSFEKQLTLKEISKKMQISREKTRQIKQKALRRLKAHLSTKPHK